MTYRFFLPCAVFVAIVACAANDGGSSGPPALLTTLPRALSSPEQSVIAADNQLGFDLLARARAASPGDNVLLSPLSAGMALGMTINGAAGATLDSMRKALRLGTTSVADINAGYASLLSLLASLDGTTTFNIANSIWADSSLAVLPTFLNAGRTNFNADVRNVNLYAPATIGTINDWVSSKTNGKIPTIIDQIDPSQVMFLINAIYFKGSWRQAFDPKNTMVAPFYAADGTTQQVPTMVLSGSISYGAATDAQVVELPYGDGAYAMTLVRPATGQTITQLMSGLTAEHFAGWVAQLRDERISVLLPKFTFQYKRQLNDDLAALGMGIAFSPVADFSRIGTPAGGQSLYLSNVTQKTYVDVNEEGTTAAAATSVGVTTTSVPPTIEFNQPFLFILRERLSGTIFFVGQVNRIP